MVKKTDIISGLLANIFIYLLTNVIWPFIIISLGLMYSLSTHNFLATIVLVVLLALIIAIMILKQITGVRMNRRFWSYKFNLYLKGYRLRPLREEELFKRYHDCKFVGRDKLPHIELFVNKDGLPMSSFESKFDNNAEFKLNLDYSIGKEILKFNQAIYEENDNLSLKDLKIDTENRKVILFFQKTKYSSYLISNLFTDTFLPTFNRTVRDILESYQSDNLLNGSKFSNQAGITSLLLSKDGKIILLRNKKTNQTYPSTICGSTSGTIELVDADTRTTPIPFLAMYREINEELHLTRNDISELRLLAITKDMTRGGVPEFIFFAKSNIPSAEIQRKFTQHYEHEYSYAKQEIEKLEKKGFIIKNWNELNFDESQKSCGEYNPSALTAIYYYENYVKTELYNKDPSIPS